MLSEALKEGQETAVLCSGGLDSVVLAADEARRARVQPLYVRTGLAWEAAEEAALTRLLAAPVFGDRVLAPVRLELSMRDVYPPDHWAIRGVPPVYDTPDRDVYLVGRNIVLLAKASVFCVERRITRIALGLLAGNPFPDATPDFFAAMGRALSLGLSHDLVIDAPFTHLRKADVIKLGVTLGVPLELTLSCMKPVAGCHCGECSKCRERRDAFAEAGVADRTAYAAPAPR